MKIGEFFIDLVVDAGKSEMTINGLISSIGELEAATVGELGVLFELAKGLGQLAEVSIKDAMSLLHLTSTTNESAEAFEHWKIVAAATGVEGEKVTSAMKKIDDQIVGMKSGTIRNSPLMQLANRLGIDLNKIQNASDLFEAIQKNKVFQGMKPGQQADILRTSAIDEDLNLMLAMNDQKRAKIALALSAVGKTMSKDEMKRWADIGIDFAIIKKQVSEIGHDIANWISPGVLKSAELMINILSKIRNNAPEVPKVLHEIFGETTEAEDRDFDRRVKPLTDIFKRGWQNLQLQPIGPNPALMGEFSSRDNRPNVTTANTITVHAKTDASADEIADSIGRHRDRLHSRTMSLLDPSTVK